MAETNATSRVHRMTALVHLADSSTPEHSRRYDVGFNILPWVLPSR